jgi:uncharacterized protein (TIGR02996 family)
VSDGDDFLAAVAAEPDADAPRLVYADWLDERGGPGDVARAEFIRLTVGEREATFWPPGRAPKEGARRPRSGRASELCHDNWQSWTERLRDRLAGTTLLRWIDTPDCCWGYRRGFVAVFEGTQQVLLDAWDDLFRLGPVEEVRVNNLWHFGTLSALHQFLDRPCLKALRMEASDLRDDCVDWLIRLSDWFRRLNKVELTARNPDAEAAGRLVAWLAAGPSLGHVTWQGRAIRPPRRRR